MKIGLNNFRYAILTEGANGTASYGGAKKPAKAISCSVNITNNSATLYADDVLAESDTSFQSGTVTMGIDDEDIEAEFGQYNIDKKDLENLINIIFTAFKMNSAIEYSQSTLSPEERKEYLEYRRFDNYLTLQASTRAKNILSFLPVKSGGKNNAIAYVKKVCKCDDNVARNIMEVLFSVIGIEGELFRRHANKEAYQIDASRFILKNSKTSKYYRCDKCGSVTPYNVHSICTRPDCEGTLREIDPDVELAKNFSNQKAVKQQIQQNHSRRKRLRHRAQSRRKPQKQTMLPKAPSPSSAPILRCWTWTETLFHSRITLTAR